MTDLTPNSVVQHLLSLSRQLEEHAKALDGLEIEAVNSREDATMMYAKAFLMTDGSVEVRKQKAIIASHDQRLAAETAEALVRGAKRQIDTFRIRIDVGRSASALVRAEMNI